MKKEEIVHRHSQKLKGSGITYEPLHEHLELAAIGLESEFTVYLNGKHVKPEDLFKDPTDFVRQPLMHRQGTSYHLPTGGAVYFDTGVIEVATPVIEIERGCAARAGRSLWEGILFLRRELDEWENQTGNRIRLEGFSTHYNISFERPDVDGASARSVHKLAKLLVYILPFPVMLLAANRSSTGIGVRPRGNRIEITADFTPDPSLMIAAATFITGVVREVMTWPSYDLEELANHRLPVVDKFKPIKHTSRKGWLAKNHCFDANPFECDVNDPRWAATVEGNPGKSMSLREIAKQVFEYFWRPIARLADPFTYRLLSRIMEGHSSTLLEMPARPESYDDVGRLCTWDNLFSEQALARSRYERVLMHAIAGEKLRIGRKWYRPASMKGWSKVVFVPADEQRRDTSSVTEPVSRQERQVRHVFSIDYLINHLQDWGRRRPGV
jgi:hypothetical protein